ncbi:hypothetical protein JCM5350_007182 [Sporobolomyces pararoseus]
MASFLPSLLSIFSRNPLPLSLSFLSRPVTHPSPRPSYASLQNLPLELLEEIASHFDTFFPSLSVDSTQVGNQISLVSRRFRFFGQKLRWRHLRIDFSSIYSLSTHLELHPHLSSLVHCFEVRDPPNISRAPVRSEEDFHELVEVLGKLKALRRFGVVGKVNSALVEILEAAGNLDLLKQLYFVIAEDLIWTPECQSTILRGFKSLVNFSLQAHRLSLPPRTESQDPARQHLGGLVVLRLGWLSSVNAPPFLSDLIPQIFDLSSLRNCDLLDYAIATSLPVLIPHALNIQNLHIHISRPNITAQLVGLLANLNRMKFLEMLTISNNQPEGGLFEAPFALVDLLQALPPSIKTVDARVLCFDYFASPTAELPLSDNSSIVRIYTVYVVEGEGRRLHVWMDKREGEQHWYKLPKAIV